MVHWAENFKPPTIQALVLLLRRYASDIHGCFHIDVEIAYIQNLTKLTSVIAPLVYLRRYLTAVNKTLAPDLKMLEMHAEFIEELQGGGLIRALEKLDAKALVEHTAALKDADSSGPVVPKQSLRFKRSYQIGF